MTISGVGKMIKIFSAILFSIIFLLSATTYAKVVEFEASGSYRMGENDTMIQAKEKAKEIAVRDIMGKAGVFIMSNTTVKNSKLIDDEITVKTANLLQIKSCEYTKTTEENTFVFHAYVIATLDDKIFTPKLIEEMFKGKTGSTDTKNKNYKKNEYEWDIFRTLNHFSQRDYATATLNLTTIISAKSGDVPAQIFYLRSVARFGLEQYNEALSDIRRAIQLDGKNPLYYVQEGFIRLAVSQLYIKWNQYGEAKSQYLLAEEKCTTALNFKKHYWPAHHCRAIARYLNDNIRKSVNEADNARSHGGKGISYVEEFSDYINARYKGRHKDLPRDSIQPILISSVIGLASEAKNKNFKAI